MHYPLTENKVVILGQKMFKARLISLSGGQSYENVSILEYDDILSRGIPAWFDDWTACFISDGELITTCYTEIRIIELFATTIRTGPNSTFYDRIIVQNGIIYDNVDIICPSNWERMGIPDYFPLRYNIPQMAFKCQDRIYVSHFCNIESMIQREYKSPVHSKMTKNNKNKKCSKGTVSND